MELQFPCVTPVRQGAEISPGPSILSNHIDTFHDNDVIEVAYHDVRRSVSPEVADYIFRPRLKRRLQKTQAKAGWTYDQLLSLPIAGTDLLQLTVDNLSDLAELAANLWTFGTDRYLDCCVHVSKILIAWHSASDLGSKVDNWKWISNLSIVYEQMKEFDKSEALLTGIIEELSSTGHNNPAVDEFRSLLGLLQMKQGQHDSGEALCIKAMVSLRSALGLIQYRTWHAYYITCLAFDIRGKFDNRQRLFKKFFNDVYQEVSSQIMPNLRALFDLCETYIDSWMPESRLQRLARNRYIRESPLGIPERHFIVLSTVLAERWKKDVEFGAPRQIFVDLKRMTYFSINSMLLSIAQMISLRIEAVRRLKSCSLRQEALKVIQNLKLTKFLVPLFVFAVMHKGQLWAKDFDWKAAEQNVIRSLDDATIEDPPEPAGPGLPAHVGSLDSALVTAESHDTHQLDLLSGSESAIMLSSAGGRLSAGASLDDLGLYDSTAIAAVSPLPTPNPTGPQIPHTFTQLPSPPGLDHIIEFSNSASLSWGIESSRPRPPSASQSCRLSDDVQSHKWFSPAMTFSQPLTPIQGLEPASDVRAHAFSPVMTFSQPLAPIHELEPANDVRAHVFSPPRTFPQLLSPTQLHQPLNDAPPQTRFSPMMMMNASMPLFDISRSQTPHLFRMSPPARPDRDSPAAAPSSMLEDLRDFSISPTLFGIYSSPLRPPSLASSSPPS